MTTIEGAARALQDVETRANELAGKFDLARALLIVLALPFIVIGWVARLVYRVLVVVCAWAWAAVEIGWKRAASRKGNG